MVTTYEKKADYAKTIEDQALDNYNLVIDQKSENNPEYFYNRGVAKTKFGNNEREVVDIKECIKLKPSHAKGRETLVLFWVK